MKSIKSETASKLIACLIVFVFIALIFSQADKKFVLDELDFPILAKATSESWRPVYYRGEGTPQHVGLYHPPLYIYALAAYVKVFGFSENTVRSFGLLCTLLTALLTVGIAARMMHRDRLRFFIPIFFGLYLLNPYTIANTTLPDIDQTILPVLITLFVFLLFGDKSSNKWLAGVFCLLLWAKLTTPLVLAPFAFVYWSIQTRSPLSALLRGLVVFGGGALLFLASYWLYCNIADLPFKYTFEFLAHSFTKGGDSGGLQALLAKIQQNFSHSPALVAWMTAPFLFLFVASFTVLSTQKTSDPNRIRTLLLAGLSAFIAVFYCGLIAPFGGFFKYPFPAFQFACLAVAWVIAVESEGPLHKSGAVLVAAFALIAMVGQTYLGQNQPDIGPVWTAKNLALAALLLGGLFGIAMAYQPRERHILHITFAVVTGVAIGMGLSISRAQAIAAFPTKYSYGQRGMDETVAYLREQLTPGEVIWSMKDVGFYTGNHYSESYGDFFSENGKEKIIKLSESGIRFFVATKGIGEDNIEAYPDIRSALEECCVLVKNFGNYYIYKARR